MIDAKTHGGVARVFNRHEKANALDSRLLKELLDTLREVSADASLRAVVLGGHGRVFCGGADVHEMEELDEAGAAAFAARRGHRRGTRARRGMRSARRGRSDPIRHAGSAPGQALERVLKSLLAGSIELFARAAKLQR